LYIKALVSTKKQFSIDSLLDWEGHLLLITLIPPTLSISACGSTPPNALDALNRYSNKVSALAEI